MDGHEALAALKGRRQAALESILIAARKKKESFQPGPDELRELVSQCDKRSANIHRADASRGSHELLEAHLVDQREKRRKTLENLDDREVVERVKMVRTAKIVKWPTRLGKKLNMAGSDLALRELAEKSERERWLAELKMIVKKAKLPVASRSSEESLMLRIAKGRRPSILRKHVKTWQKVGLWMESTYGKIWPASPSEFAEYIEAIVPEPCARSAPEAAYKTLMFLEYAGEVEESEFVHKSSAVRNAIEEAHTRLAAVELRPSRQALILPLAIVEAMEEMVVSDNRAPMPGTGW